MDEAGRHRYSRRRAFSNGDQLDSRDQELDDDLDYDDEKFLMEREKCRRQRLEHQRKANKRRKSSTSLPSKPSSSDSPAQPADKHRVCKRKTSRPCMDNFAQTDEDPVIRLADLHARPPGYRRGSGAARQLTYPEIRVPHHLLAASVRRSSSDGARLHELPVITFVKSDALETPSSDPTVSHSDLVLDSLLNPHLSSFRRESADVHSEELLCSRRSSRQDSTCSSTSTSMLGSDDPSCSTIIRRKSDSATAQRKLSDINTPFGNELTVEPVPRRHSDQMVYASKLDPALMPPENTLTMVSVRGQAEFHMRTHGRTGRDSPSGLRTRKSADKLDLGSCYIDTSSLDDLSSERRLSTESAGKTSKSRVSGLFSIS